jgi:hypothetical protein
LSRREVQSSRQSRRHRSSRSSLRWQWYTLAKRMQIEDQLDETLEMADDSTNDWIDREGPDGKKYRVFNPDNIRRSNLQIAARHWLISKLMPKK